MSAKQPGNPQHQMDARALCISTETALSNLVDVMNKETVLLRASLYEQAAQIGVKKAEIAQHYVTLARLVENEHERLTLEAPAELKSLVAGHEKLTTQMAENLRVLATARDVTQTLLSDVAASVGAAKQPNTYGASGQLSSPAGRQANGIAINRAL